MINVKGKWALLTGASRGIGYQIAKFMAEQGCNLVLHSREIKHTEKVLQEVTAAGVEAYAVAADLGDVNQVRAMLKEIDEKGTQIDIIFNNAGMQVGYRSNFFATPIEDFTTSFMVNTIAPAMICNHFMPRMIKNGFGRVLNTTSGINRQPEQTGYSVSKAALDKYTFDIGSKVNGTDVMINLTDPNWCRTDLGGPRAPNSPESVIPGIVVGVFVNDKISGRNFAAQDFKGMTLEQAVNHAEAKMKSPY